MFYPSELSNQLLWNSRLTGNTLHLLNVLILFLISPENNCEISASLLYDVSLNLKVSVLIQRACSQEGGLTYVQTCFVRPVLCFADLYK